MTREEPAALGRVRALPGLERVAEKIEELIGLSRVQQLRAERGLRTMPVTMHMAFVGNPGTGKKTVARLVAQAMADAGVLKAEVAGEQPRPARVGRIVTFPDYSAQTLMEIFQDICDQHGYFIGSGTADAVKAELQRIVLSGKVTRGNARLVRNLFEEAVGRHARRLSGVRRPTTAELSTLLLEDVSVTSATRMVAESVLQA